MIVKSKKTGLPHSITRKDWDAMRKRGDNRHYQIIDDTDEIIQEKIEIKEISVMEFEKPKEFVSDAPDKLDNEDEKDIDFYRQELRKAGIDFRWNTGLEKLKQKYEEI